MLAGRLSTGIPGLDEVLMGGFLPGRTYLVVGAPGAGKTILALHWLLAGAKQGQKSLYITLAEPMSEVLKNAAAFGWDLQDITTLDFPPMLKVAFKSTACFRPARWRSPFFGIGSSKLWKSTTHNGRSSIPSLF